MVTSFDTARALHLAGNLAEAAAAYREVPTSSPDYWRAANNLGLLLVEQASPAQAIECYRSGIERAPEQSVLHYNLGCALHVQGRLAAAIDAYRRALSLDPESLASHYNLGRALWDTGKLTDAAGCFQRALDLAPRCCEAASNLGAVLFELSDMEGALLAFRQAADIRPDLPSEHFNIGKTLAVLERDDEAIESLRRSIEIEPKSSIAQKHLAQALLRSGKKAEAEEVYRQWLKHLPEDSEAAHLLAASVGKKASRAPDDYIRSAFDHFAQEFESALAKLDYRAPALLAQMVNETIGTPRHDLDVLDAGCGTGLAAPALRPYASDLIGVDLSAGMLEKARGRDQYDALVEAELTQYMTSAVDTCDLVFAADTFNYFGDLAPLFQSIAIALQPGGHAFFSLEKLDSFQHHDEDWRLQPCGRYAHSHGYVTRALHESPLQLLRVAEGVLRKENAEPVFGWLVAATLPSR